MKTIYLIRHCTTPSNQSGVFQGSTDISLAEFGLQQAEYLGKRFSQKKIDHIFVSPLLRTVQTAEAIHKYHPTIKLEKDDRLREINGGIFENHSLFKFMEEYPKNIYNLFFKPGLFRAPEGESSRDVYQRLDDFGQDLLARTGDFTAVIVTHGFALMMFRSWLEKTALENVKKQIVINASVSKINVYDDASHQAEYWNDIKHLPSDLQFVPSLEHNAAFKKQVERLQYLNHASGQVTL